MLPSVTDTADSLERMFNNFKEAGAGYLFPATITLIGEDEVQNRRQDHQTRFVKMRFYQRLK